MSASAKVEANEGRTKCKVYSRVVGFIRPVDNWNDSKTTEFGQRKVFLEEGGSRCGCDSVSDI